MSWSSSGLIIDKVGEEYRDMPGLVRHVFAVMATFVGNSERDRSHPTCFAAQSTIAKRAGYSTRTVRKALSELEDAKAIVHGGYQVRTGGGDAHKTVRWEMPGLLALAARYADKGPARHAAKDAAPRADNPSELQRPQGSAERGRSGTADAASAQGGLAAAAPSMGEGASEQPSGIVGEIMQRLGYSQSVAERWHDRKLSLAPGGAPTSEVKWLRACIAKQEAEAAEAPSSSGRSGTKSTGPSAKNKGGKATKRSSAPARRGKNASTAEQIAEAKAVLAGETTAKEVAERWDKSLGTVQQWVRSRRESEANVRKQPAASYVRQILAAAAEGLSPAEIVERVGYQLRLVQVVLDVHGSGSGGAKVAVLPAAQRRSGDPEPDEQPKVWHVGDGRTVHPVYRKSVLIWGQRRNRPSVEQIAEAHLMPADVVRAVLAEAGVLVEAAS